MDMSNLRRRHEVRALSVDGIEWQYIEIPGSGRPIVLLPGALGTAEFFIKQIQALEGALHLIAVTYPALSRIDDLVTSLAAFLNDKGLRVVHLLGTSLGGYVAQAFAMRYPDRCDRLVLANTFSDASFIQGKLRTPADLSALEAKHLQAEAFGRFESMQDSNAAVAEFRAFMMEQIRDRQTPESIKASQVCLASVPPILEPAVDEERVLLIGSMDDPVAPLEVFEKLRALYPAAATVVLPAGGHFPAFLQSERYNSLIQEHFAEQQAMALPA
jgi:maspardin